MLLWNLTRVRQHHEQRSDRLSIAVDEADWGRGTSWENVPDAEEVIFGDDTDAQHEVVQCFAQAADRVSQMHLRVCGP